MCVLDLWVAIPVGFGVCRFVLGLCVGAGFVCELSCFVCGFYAAGLVVYYLWLLFCGCCDAGEFGGFRFCLQLVSGCLDCGMGLIAGFWVLGFAFWWFAVLGVFV